MRKILLICLIMVMSGCNNSHSIEMIDLSDMSLSQIEDYAHSNNLVLDIKQEYNNELDEGAIISQSVAPHAIIREYATLAVVVSKGPIPLSLYREYKVNELGNVPIMMYHGIVNMKSEDTSYTGGNVDVNGYNRTTESFISDLEMYYSNNYRMMRLIDYMNGEIDIPLGKSPIILTFDDGNINNINILGLDDNNNLIIDPNSAVGILESFKDKYPDFNVTATFFLTSSLFGQPQYNEQILNWLVDNDYDIGNHTKNHIDFKTINSYQTQDEVSYMYMLFDNLIKNKYIHVVALPFGSPGKKSHVNFPYIIDGIVGNYHYVTEGTLQVGWDASYSPFHVNYDKTFIKRVRAW
ncbi:MAG: polysaccharide deacetylase family protein, partial [Bacilli bacterium]